ncbi:MAG: 30S ribosomal protein S17 [Betaproteobacteria bacterium]|mgnify:FL=1|jgi:small subunit ribosomal protein S17|nr:30S ribosomal protein S17 [Pseudomonadota bacterium]NBO04007.1 30S ribosomal protein S17 [Betaproteobacteria bacterium]HAB46766.1 30S ribosomal protein S17 [Lautropia sp.]NBO94812.1 30S ribosomal protein S17 [Betaproteobacteria bacterium]NBP35216.1 30S ribosomal protein S17 [Betaproteobacteria bacterium]
MNQASQTAAAGETAVAKAVKRSLVGRVTSNKMMKTVTVLIERREKHPLYGKYLVQSKKVHAHTEQAVGEGDLVEVQECRPISKTKTWSVVRVIERAA